MEKTGFFFFCVLLIWGIVFRAAVGGPIDGGLPYMVHPALPPSDNVVPSDSLSWRTYVIWCGLPRLSLHLKCGLVGLDARIPQPYNKISYFPSRRYFLARHKRVVPKRARRKSQPIATIFFLCRCSPPTTHSVWAPFWALAPPCWTVRHVSKYCQHYGDCHETNSTLLLDLPGEYSMYMIHPSCCIWIRRESERQCILHTTSFRQLPK